MANLSIVPKVKQHLLEYAIKRLSKVQGIMAIVLGGSYASGKYHEASDLDIGLYYAEASPFSIAEIQGIAKDISSQGTPTVTGFYDWGPWVNGGAWIYTEAGKVDFLYRNLDQVERTIDEAQQGLTRHDYDQQPTYGFYSVIYLAETQICIPLHDPQHQIARLKRRVEVYPPRLKQKIIADSLWSAEFTLLHARNFAADGDVYNSAGCLGRVASNLTQALFALNENYFLSDKKVMDTLSSFKILPPGYVDQVLDILAQPGRTTAELVQSVNSIQTQWGSVVSLAGEAYRP